MKRLTTQFVSVAASAVAAMLAVSAASPALAQYTDADSHVEYAPFEKDYPARAEVDGLLLDLPAGYFATVEFPPMGNFEVEQPPVLLAGFDPLETP